jgi:hypothetical protein
MICANLFISTVASTDGNAYLAVGCDEGVWIGTYFDSQCKVCAPVTGMYVLLLLSWLSITALRRVLSLKMVTQCAMLEEYGIFLVLANKVMHPLVR